MPIIRGLQLPVSVLPAVEEGVPISPGHVQDGSCLTFVLLFLRPGADGEFGDGGGSAGVGHGEGIAGRGEERVGTKSRRA